MQRSFHLFITAVCPQGEYKVDLAVLDHHRNVWTAEPQDAVRPMLTRPPQGYMRVTHAPEHISVCVCVCVGAPERQIKYNSGVDGIKE